jgi:hypothetical protein
MCTTKRYITDPTTTKAFAAWKAVLFDRDLALSNVNLGSDAMGIVQAAFYKED